MMRRILIKNGRLIDPVNKIDNILDLLIEHKKIKKIAKKIEIEENNDYAMIDALGKMVIPGLIDMHAHFKDPGNTDDEDLESGSRCAAIGGYTTVAIMPDTNPVIDNAVVVEYILSKASRVSLVNIIPIGAISKGEEGKELSNMYSLYNSGVRLFSDDGKSVHDADLMRMALQYSKVVNIPLSVHEDVIELSGQGVMREGFLSSKMGLVGVPDSAEAVMLARDLILAEEVGGRLHINEVSRKLSLDYLRFAKSRGVKVTAGASIHHLVMNEQEVSNYNTNGRISPPLGSEEDRIALLQGLKDGTIDIIVTSHDPHNPTSKLGAFNYNNPPGMLGLEVALSIVLEEIVGKNILSLGEVIKKMSSNPAYILGLKEKGNLGIGMDADIIIADANKEWINDTSKSYSKSRNDPYNGKNMKGKVEYTIVGGKIVVENASLIKK
ncbi:MAG: dihydroorotase [Atribacterota bacterium]